MIVNCESDEEGIIPTKDVIKRMAIVDGCNVLHLCAGMGLHSRAEQQMFDQKKPDAIGLLLVVKKLFEEDFDVRVFISFSYMSENKVSNLFILQEFKALGILTVVPPNVHDDIAILEYASQVGGFIVSNDKFREFKYCQKILECVERTIRFKFKHLKRKINEKNNRDDNDNSESSTSSLPRKKSKSDINKFQLGMELQMEIDQGKSLYIKYQN
uniref:RNase NYN domain-containing protein n=1 Tax=Meloidogyne incognita TaxID=6306 RepID=A0A914LR39_MELIC